jgi:uncharacterized membrane protein
MFKLVYQSFILYSLCSGYVLVRFSEILKSRVLISIYKLFFTLVFVIQLIYPYFAIKSYYGEFRLYHGLDGLTYLKDLYPDNYQAILWINKNITGQPVMLEAVGDSYTTFNQVSSSTGLPTIQGWIVHEWLWRGGYDIPASRQMDVENIYSYFSGKSSNIKEEPLNNSDEYIVNYGDNLWKIAKKHLNNEFLWKELAELNNLENPSLIYPYQKLIIPVDYGKDVIFNENNKNDDNVSNIDEVKAILNKYQVEYIFVGDKEYEKYPELNPEKFKNIGAKVVFQSGKTIIYQL